MLPPLLRLLATEAAAETAAESAAEVDSGDEAYAWMDCAIRVTASQVTPLPHTPSLPPTPTARHGTARHGTAYYLFFLTEKKIVHAVKYDLLSILTSSFILEYFIQYSVLQ
jgi:hypothetical protein